MLHIKFGVNWLLDLGEEAKNRFSRWPPSWISDWNDFSYSWSTSHPDASYQVLSQLAQGCRRSRLLKQLLTPHDGHWLTTIAHHEHFVLRWANKAGSSPTHNALYQRLSFKAFLVLKKYIFKCFLTSMGMAAFLSVKHDHLNKCSIPLWQYAPHEVWWKVARWFQRKMHLKTSWFYTLVQGRYKTQSFLKLIRGSITEKKHVNQINSFKKLQSQQQQMTFWFFLSFIENKTRHFMWIICQADDSHEMSRLIFFVKIIRMLSATILLGTLRVKAQWLVKD